MRGWLDAKVLVPALTALLGSAFTFVGVVLTLADDPPYHPDCTAARQALVAVFDKHPEAAVPFNDPVLEQACKINEFLRSLETHPSPTPTPPVVRK